MKNFLWLVVKSVCIFTLFTETNVIAQQLEVNNGNLHLKVDLARGGSISYLSKSGSNYNLVNIHDEGRYIQQSYYGGNTINRQNSGQSSRWSPWSWNPIQAGDAFGNRAKILESNVTGNTIYVKCIPKLWDMNNVDAEAVIEQWTTIDGNVLKVHNKLTSNRTDNLYGEGVINDQELPAVYPIADLKNVYGYFGNRPFKNAPKDNPTAINLSGGTGFWGRYRTNIVTENWMSFANDNNWGMTVYTPISLNFLAGIAGNGGGGGANDGNTSYIAPLVKTALNKKSVYEYDYYLIIGDVDQARAQIYDIKNNANIGWNFESTIDGWSRNKKNCNISWLNGDLVFEVTGDDPYVYNTEKTPIFSTSLENTNISSLDIRVKNNTSSNQGAIYLWYNNNRDFFVIPFNLIPNNNGYQNISIDLTKNPNWSKNLTITDIRIDPNQTGHKGKIYFDYIKFNARAKSITITGPESLNLTDKAQMSVNIVPANTSNKAVNYSVNNPNIATIDANGILTPKSKGDVLVIATAKDGSGVSGSKKIKIGHAIKGWEFKNGDEGWNLNRNNCNIKWWSNESLVFDINGDDPYVYNSFPTGFSASNVNTLELRVKNETFATNGEIFLFLNGGFNQFLRIPFPLKPNSYSDQYEIVKVDLSKVAGWNENLNITSVRLDPVSTSGKKGMISYDYIRFTNEIQVDKVFGWEFGESVEGWSLNPNSSHVFWGNNGDLVFNVTGSDPYVWNVSPPNFSTADLDFLHIRVKNQTSSKLSSLLLWADGGKEHFVVDFPITPNNPNYEIVTIDLSKLPAWINSSTISNVRIEANNDGALGTISYDYIRFSNKDHVERVFGWEFGSSVEGWSLSPNSSHVFWGNNGDLVFNVTGSDPYVWNVSSPNFSTSNLNYLHIRVKNQTSSKLSSLLLWSDGGNEHFVVDFPITPNNSNYELVTVDLSKLPSWVNSSTISNVRIEANNDGALGNIAYDYIRFSSSSRNSEYSVRNVRAKKETVEIVDLPNKKFRFYPNPVEKLLVVEGAESIKKVEIYDILGKLLESESYSIENKFKTELNVEKYTSGIYILKVFYGQENSAQYRFIKN